MTHKELFTVRLTVNTKEMDQEGRERTERELIKSFENLEKQNAHSMSIKVGKYNSSMSCIIPSLFRGPANRKAITEGKRLQKATGSAQVTITTLLTCTEQIK